MLDGYRLSQPQGCPDDVYSLMLLCWAQRPCERPAFSAILASHLQPLSTRLARSGLPIDPPLAPVVMVPSVSHLALLSLQW